MIHRFLVLVLLISSCKTTRSLDNKEERGFILEVIEEQLIQPNYDLDFVVRFSLTNNTDKDVWVPNPKVPSKKYALELPEFFDIDILSDENCTASDYVSRTNKKSYDDYTKISVNESVIFEMNPKKIFPSIDCPRTSGVIEFQIIYKTRPYQIEYLKEYGLPEEIVSNLLVDTLKSQIVQLEIK